MTLVSEFTAHNSGWGPHSVLANPVHRASPWSLECLPASFMCLSCVPTVCPAGQAPPEGTWVLGPLSPPAGGGDIRSGCWRPVPALPAPALGSWCVWGLGRVLWDSEEVSVNPALSPWRVPCSRVCSPACLTSRFPFSLGERNGGQGQLGATWGLGSRGCCHNTPDRAIPSGAWGRPVPGVHPAAGAVGVPACSHVTPISVLSGLSHKGA